ncbi:MAG: YfhO family protein, partial [Lachnospiraceae bacterium]|nr:YfhO family protein [Lachnospiraceae bacterium]
AMALGSEAVGFFTYYLSSPLLLMLVFFDEVHLPEAVTLMAGLKFMLMSAACDRFLIYYLRRRGHDGMPRTLAFSLSYTFCAYMMAYAINPMWMEVYILMPVVLWMLMRLTDERKYTGYVLTLALMIWCNYYLAFMVCLFIIFWTIWLLIDEPAEWFKKLMRVGVCSLWAVCLDMVALLPTVFELAGSPKDSGLLGAEGEGVNLMPWQLAAQYRIFKFDGSSTYFGRPLIYAGTVMAVLCLGFFCIKAVSLKEKLCMGMLMMILAASMCVDKINLLWHAGMYPSGYPYRQAFLTVFVLIVCAARMFNTVKIKKKELINASLVVIQAAVLMANGVYIFKVQTASGMLGASEYRRIYNENASLFSRITGDGEFYRIDDCAPREQNDGMMYGYNSLTHYSSAGLMSTRFFLKKLGFHDDGLYTAFGNDNTATAESLLGIRYVNGCYRRDEYAHQEEMLYENPYWLPVAMRVDSLPQADMSDPFSMQESIYSAYCGYTPDIFKECGMQVQKGAGTDIYDCETLTAGRVYMYISGIEDRIQNIAIYLDDEFLSGYGNLGCYSVLDLGWYDEGESFTLRIYCDGEEPDTGRAIVVTEDMSVLHQAFNDSIEKGLQAENTSSSHFVIQIPELMDSTGVATTIPYENSWKAYLNGHEVTTGKIYDTFLYIPVNDSGVLELSYIPKGLIPGLLMSAAAAILLAFGALFGMAVQDKKKT